MTDRALVTLPNSQTRAVWVVALFVTVQIADAVLTLAGVERFGPGAEGNPILSFYMATCGVVVTLITAKSLAILLATTLYVRSQYLAIATLTVLYVVGAIAPWMITAAP